MQTKYKIQIEAVTKMSHAFVTVQELVVCDVYYVK